jgi:hypothetical protein
MRRHVLQALLAVLFLSSVALPVMAHHSFEAEFNGDKLLTFTGVLTKFEWQNPHGWFYLDVKDNKGNVTNWAFEIAAPNVLVHFDENIRRYFLENQGKLMSVAASPARNGTNKAAADKVKFMDGRIMAMGSKRYHGDLDSEQILKVLK